MKKPSRATIVIAVVWGIVILAAAWVLKETPYGASVVLVLGGSAGASLIVHSGSVTKRWAGVVCEAVVWAAVIMGAMVMLWGTPQMAQLLLMLGGGAAVSLFVLAWARRGEWVP